MRQFFKNADWEHGAPATMAVIVIIGVFSLLGTVMYRHPIESLKVISFFLIALGTFFLLVFIGAKTTWYIKQHKKKKRDTAFEKEIALRRREQITAFQHSQAVKYAASQVGDREDDI